MAASDADARIAVEKSLKAGQRAGAFTSIVDVYGGKGVLSSADGAWWVKDGKVYAVNGIAAALSPKAPKAPPSVNVRTLQAAAEGKAFPLPPNLGITCEELIAKVTANIKELNVKTKLDTSLKPQTFYEYSLNVGQATAAQFTFKEVGGLVSSIELNGYALDDPKDAKTPATSLLAVALIHAAAPDKESGRQLVGIMLKSKTGSSTTLGKLTMTFKREKGMLDVTITPQPQS